MTRNKISLFLTTCVIALAACVVTPDQAMASLAASDDASDSVYNDGWNSPLDNGGTGFGPWTSIGQDQNYGGGFIATGTDIDVGGEAFGVYGNNGGTGHAIRSFSGDLLANQTFSISMDNETIDSGNKVGFGLRNSTGDDLFEFFFTGGDSFYSVNELAGSVATSTGYTTGGLSLAFTLTDADTFSLAIDLLSNGQGIDETVTGDLLANVDQGIEELRLFNANGGPNVYFNSMAISAVPEVSAALALPLLLGSVWGIRSLKRRRAAC